MNATAEREMPLVFTGDPSWELVQRIVGSPLFARSERLSSFLLFVSRLSLAGENHRINEKTIGTAVFGRKADYDTSVDGIVRTHATRLRQRLERYFDEYGQNETLRVEILPGSYVPVFTARKISEPVAVATVVEAIRTEALAEITSEPATSVQPARWHKTLRARRIAIVVACFWTALSIAYLATHPRLVARLPAEWKGAHHQLWTLVFNKNINTVVVSGDMALINFETQTGRSVMLGEYTRNSYVNQYMSQFALESFSPSSALFLTKTMTVVDSQFIERLLRLPGVDLDRTVFRSARDIELPNLQSGNVVLLGNFRFNPWVQAFEPKMNFYFADNNAELTNSVLRNRSPHSNEQASYVSTDVNHVHTEYSVISLQPNLNGSEMPCCWKASRR